MPLSVISESECSITENVIGKKCKHIKDYQGLTSNIPNHLIRIKRDNNW